MSIPQLAEIYNYLEITPRLATAGQPKRDQFAAIREAGFDVVINLATLDPPHGLADEAEIVAAQGMDYIHIPVVWTEPTSANLDAFFEAMQQNAERKCFVHCIANMRVSAFLFLYRTIQQGVDVAEAEQLLHQIWQPNPIWAEFIDEELTRHNIER